MHYFRIQEIQMSVWVMTRRLLTHPDGIHPLKPCLDVWMAKPCIPSTTPCWPCQDHPSPLPVVLTLLQHLTGHQHLLLQMISLNFSTSCKEVGWMTSVAACHQWNPIHWCPPARDLKTYCKVHLPTHLSLCLLVEDSGVIQLIRRAHKALWTLSIVKVSKVTWMNLHQESTEPTFSSQNISTSVVMTIC